MSASELLGELASRARYARGWDDEYIGRRLASDRVS